jgi:hypothetical protein
MFIVQATVVEYTIARERRYNLELKSNKIYDKNNKYPGFGPQPR